MSRDILVAPGELRLDLFALLAGESRSTSVILAPPGLTADFPQRAAMVARPGL